MSLPSQFFVLAARHSLTPMRAAIRHWVLSAFPRSAESAVDYDQPRGDPGLFGPDSATWRVHSDFPGMLAGGLAALTLQTLHPLALAGVWDHSNFREDLMGRLRRTVVFVGATTYASLQDSQMLVAHVRRIHGYIKGFAEDGRPYSANDPDLLTWVHVTEAYSFLQGYRRYSHVTVPAGAADRYYDEVRRIAEALGARNVPASEQAVENYFRQILPELAFTERSREVLKVMAQVRLPVPVAGLSRDLFLLAGAALLPVWANNLLEQSPGNSARQKWRPMRCGRSPRCFAARSRTASPVARAGAWAWRLPF